MAKRATRGVGEDVRTKRQRSGGPAMSVPGDGIVTKPCNRDYHDRTCAQYAGPVQQFANGDRAPEHAYKARNGEKVP